MAGVRGRSGGRRVGAGRKPGRKGGIPDARTSGIRELFVAGIAKQARKLYQAALRAHKQGKGEHPGDPPSKSDPVACSEFIIDLLTRGAMKGDGRCAIHLDERVHGRVPLPLEHGGPGQGAGPITLRIVRENGNGHGSGNGAGVL